MVRKCCAVRSQRYSVPFKYIENPAQIVFVWFGFVLHRPNESKALSNGILVEFLSLNEKNAMALTIYVLNVCSDAAVIRVSFFVLKPRA